jgi:hypothetical protein
MNDQDTVTIVCNTTLAHPPYRMRLNLTENNEKRRLYGTVITAPMHVTQDTSQFHVEVKHHCSAPKRYTWEIRRFLVLTTFGANDLSGRIGTLLHRTNFRKPRAIIAAMPQIRKLPYRRRVAAIARDAPWVSWRAGINGR